MSVIAVDTSARGDALVLRTTAAGEVLAQRSLEGVHLDAALPAALAALLDSELEAVVVLTGPGSYTGVRAGMAAALGLAVARVVPLHGIGTLDAIAAAAPLHGWFLVVADAGRGGVYAADFDGSDGKAGRRHGTLRRVDAASLAGAGPPPLSTTQIAGVAVRRVSRAEALAAAVPVALALPPLRAAGLAATTVPTAAADPP